MTGEEFQTLWTVHYPDIMPVSHLFRHTCSDRWFRIHSLPESKRYAENEHEWKTLISRQNEIITDLFEFDTPIVMVTGEYNWGNNRKIPLKEEEEIFRAFSFIQLDSIELNKTEPKKYDEPDSYRPAFAQTIWKPNYHDKLLREIAKDRISGVFFVSFDKNIIVAPYDGGIDFVLKDTLTKEKYKNKYGKWLSQREDGL